MMVMRPLYGVLVLAISLSAWAGEYDGRLAWSQRVELGTLVSGQVLEVKAEPGQRVAAGQLLMRLDGRAFTAAVVAAEAEVKRRTLDKEEASRELERSQELYDRTLLSDHDLQIATIQFSNADAAYMAAQAQLVRARLDLEHSRIKSPFNALVLSRQVEVGQSVNSQLQSQPLLTVAASDTMLARVLLTEQQLTGLRPGQAATVQVAGKSYKGGVISVGLEPDAEQQYAVDVRFPVSAQVQLRAGQSARITLP